MISAYHLIWTAYGWWLPNDPRGSNSRVVRDAGIADLGPLHRGRKRILPASSEIRGFYQIARERLKYPLLVFTPNEIATIAVAFAEVIHDRGYTCYGCAIMADHVHLVVRKHRDTAEEMISCFQELSRAAVSAKPQASRGIEHPVWGGPGWKVFLESRGHIERTVEYVQRNLVVARGPEQAWPFVTVYDGWLVGMGTRRAKPQASRGMQRDGDD
jgi:REP element-mobilizing transposase RayT